ncbi:lipopolysaccharide biosynthesis protein [Dictyobacter aurantiacus]|uniref:Polysaccharide biosynthesis protein C-terminal domain-containing protein n=1 Tax=Dictyobacter aurantiacus TaxID=1936993 RepID=A0A401ZI11_9CHLR|nr:oligosaccharide flippase family protein [Dictyobacter aurantiacus]GCE06483.1 hypothetical protein KDAU_38120 [Dictyobacter aurantiacus]
MIQQPSDKASQGDSGARQLLKRAPNSYVINQIYSLWFFLSSFLFTVLITRAVTTGEYGVYAIIQTTINTIIYIVALGIEDATVTFVPRLLSESGPGVAGQLARYLLAVRLIILFVTIAIILFGLPLLATGIALLPIPGSAAVVNTLQGPLLSRFSIPIALYVFGTGISNLFSALCAARMRMHIVLVIGSITQGALLLAGFILLTLGWGIDGILWLQALVALLTALAFVCWLAPFLLKGAPHHRLPLKNIWHISISAWLTNLATGALFKQISIILLGVFLISVENIGYFNLSFQLADAANLLLVSGLTGVGGSALAAAFTGHNHQRFGQTWQALIKVETLLAAPVLVFCLFNASNITNVLYGNKYDPVWPLLTIFLFFNLLVRLLGTTIHQSGLYVLGKPRQVVASQWLGLLIVIGVGILCIPTLGAAGALIADGIAKTAAGILLLIWIAPQIPSGHRREVLVFTGRFMLALILAALPSLLWHPKDRILLGISGCLFIILCLGLLWWIKPLTQPDIELLKGMNPRLAGYLKYFSRASKDIGPTRTGGNKWAGMR